MHLGPLKCGQGEGAFAVDHSHLIRDARFFNALADLIGIGAFLYGEIDPEVFDALAEIGGFCDHLGVIGGKRNFDGQAHLANYFVDARAKNFKNGVARIRANHHGHETAYSRKKQMHQEIRARSLACAFLESQRYGHRQNAQIGADRKCEVELIGDAL